MTPARFSSISRVFPLAICFLGTVALAEEEEEDPALLVLEQNCISCHLPNLQSAHNAPDLTTISTSVDPARAVEVMRDGIPGTAMPRFGLAEADGTAVLAFLDWMGSHGAQIRQSFESLASSGELILSRVPWFEYE